MMKKKVFFTLTVILILISPVLNVNASIRPVIVTQMPDPMNIGILQNVNLTWVVIDDNPSFYSLYINNTLSKNGTIISNVITEPFSAPEGLYNITLIVTDYSNNSASSTLLINSSRFILTSSGTTSNPSPGSKTAATPGFTYEIFLSTIFIIALIPLMHKRPKTKR